MSITDPNLSDCFNDKIEEIHNKRLKTLGAILDGATGLGQCHRQFLTSALGMLLMFYVFFVLFYHIIISLSLSFLQTVSVHLLSNIVLMFVCFLTFLSDTGLKKCKNDDMMFETIQAFKKGECAMWYSCLNMVVVGTVFSFAANSSMVSFTVKHVFTSTVCSFPDLKQKSALIKEKQHEISDVISEINQKETQKDKILAKIQKLREEQAKRQEGTFTFGAISSIGLLHFYLVLSPSSFSFSVIQAQNKANKDRLRNLQKARNVFQKHLGLEIRTILGKSQLAKGASACCAART